MHTGSRISLIFYFTHKHVDSSMLMEDSGFSLVIHKEKYFPNDGQRGSKFQKPTASQKVK